MKQFSELTNEEALKAIYSSEKLSNKLYEYICDSEIEGYIMDKVHCLDNGAKWEIGTYYPSYLEVTNCPRFVDGVRESIKCFGSTERLEKLCNQCDNLYGSNLYEHYIEKLCDLYFKEEIKPSLDWVEKMSYAIYSKDIDSDLYDSLECFIECYCDDISIDDNGDIIETNIIGKYTA